MAAIAKHVGREQIIEALGQTWRVGRWTRAIWDEFLQWANTRLPDPIEVAAKHLDRFPPALQEVMVRVALDKATRHLSIGSEEVTALLNSFEGSTYLMWLLLREHQPTVKDDDAVSIALELGETVIKAAADKAAGRVEASGNSPAPEAQA